MTVRRPARRARRLGGTVIVLLAVLAPGCSRNGATGNEPKVDATRPCGVDGTVTVSVRDVSLDAERGGGSFAGPVTETTAKVGSAVPVGSEVIVVVRTAEPVTVLTVDGRPAALSDLRVGVEAIVDFTTQCADDGAGVTESVLVARSVAARG